MNRARNAPAGNRQAVKIRKKTRRQAGRRKRELFLKRCLDMAAGLTGLIVLSPLFLFVPLLIKITMPGPVFFRQERAGKGGRPFMILKFRSMKPDRQAEENHEFAKDAQRLTPFGALMRRTKLDELPQLLNVIKGDMSLVGPRPAVTEQAERYTSRQKRRLRMRPGMTGLAQVNGNAALSWEERIEYDLKYIETFSLALDMKILLKTALVVLCGEEAFQSRAGRPYSGRF